MLSMRIELANKEALTVLCSVVKHAGSGNSTKEVRGETRAVRRVFFYFLSAIVAS